MVRLLASLIQRAGGVSQVEPSHFPAGRPDVLAFLPESSFLLDMVVTHPSSPSYLSRPAAPLYCAQSAQRRKFSRYASTHTSPSCQLVPFALESFGAFGDLACAFIKKLSALSRDSVSTSLSPLPLFSSIAILLQKCNSFILSRGVVLSRTSVSLVSPS